MPVMDEFKEERNRIKEQPRSHWRSGAGGSMKTIMLIDDDIHIGNALEEALEAEGYGTLRAYSGTEALLVLEREKPDLILLDLMLPGLSGEELLPRIKGIPVIILSAKADIDNKVGLLLGGAADYVTKPFHMKELLARIAVQLRRAETVRAEVGNVLTFADLKLDGDTHRVWAGDTEIRLTRTEFAILKLLVSNSTQIISKTLLLERVSEDSPDCTESSLKTHISHLRTKLSEVSDKDYIETVWGIGFRMREL